MRAEVYLIRHGKTAGNLEGRYIGRTDEPLCGEGIRLLKEKELPLVELVYTSPYKRCLETAKILWPEAKQEILTELRESDFGDFEGKNYEELKENAAYQKWIDSNGTIPFPNGEDPKKFRLRCVEGFEKAMRLLQTEGLPRCAVVCHGGTIMSILEVYGRPEKSFYDWQVKNGSGFLLELPDTWKPGDGIPVIKSL